MLVSFIIPTHDSARTIGKCLESIFKQRCKKEVIVVDGRSKDDTVERVKRFKARLLRDDGGKIATARNVGLKAAKGGYIAFVDSDVVLPERWCEKALKLLRADDKTAGVGGPGISPEKSIVSESLNVLLFGKTPGEERYVSSIATMDALYKKKIIGSQLFDETLETGEDPDFNMRLVKKGYKLLFSEKLKVWHYHPMTVSGLMGKWYNYGKNYPLMCSKHREFRGKEYYARVLYMPPLIAFILLSIYRPVFASLAFLQVFLLYLVYFGKGVEVGIGPGILVFAGVHTLKQLAQLAGNLVGLKKLL